MRDMARQLGDPSLDSFYAYWLRIRGKKLLPRRRDFDPADIPSLLPYMTIVEAAGDRFRVRLIGTEVQRRIKGKAVTPLFLDELEHGRYLAFLTEVYRTVIAQKKPVLSHTRYPSPRGEISIRRLTVPFSERPGTVTQLMSLMVFSHAANDPDRMLTINDDAEHSMETVT